MSVPFRHQKIHAKVHKAEDGQEPEEVVEVAAVEVVRNPSRLPVLRGDACDDGNKQAAQVVAERRRGEREGGAHAPHRVRRLVVEELQLSDEGEDLGCPHDDVLRHLPEHGHGNIAIGPLVPRHHPEPRDLEKASRRHGEDGDHQADAHARQVGEAPLPTRKPSGHRNDDAVVDGNPDDDADGVEDGERG
ncbi:hypothetical protein MUK42_23890 [Musa troglodytarum]|uniref:Uncharacterized protein n=1 Tax=Musa troglodytarum TaxID=320322 RepID=A0A9E7GI21_9LILI|nr:hypothetical protein MUK42_36489 [Musa troglodytarum]URE13438.1 hypothetical protein MUK42_23890 [Musa troglodytarum]